MNDTASKIKDRVKKGFDQSQHFDLGSLISRAKIKNWVGFCIAGIVLMFISSYSGADSHTIAFLGLVHIVIIFAFDFIHKKPIKMVHLSVILFWIFYILAKYGLITLSIKLPDGRAYVPDMILSLVIAAYLADLLDKIRSYSYSKMKNKAEDDSNPAEDNK